MLKNSIIQIPDTSNIVLKDKFFTSVIILNKNSNELLKQCVDSFIKFYSNFYGEILIGDTGSNNAELKLINKYINELNKKDINIKLIQFNYYNYSKNNNEIANSFIDKRTEYLYFLNNDIEFLNNNLIQFYNIIQNKDNEHIKIGSIGSHLIFLNQMTQHNGIFVQKINNKFQFGHYNHNSFRHDYQTKEIFGNTGASLFIKKEIFNEIGGFDNNLNLFQDVKLNIELLSKGYTNVYCGTALAYHFESSTRHKTENDKIRDMNLLQQDLQKIQNYCIMKEEYFKKYINK